MGADVRFRRAKQAELLHGGERIFLAEFLSDVPVLQTKNGGAGEVHFPTRSSSDGPMRKSLNAGLMWVPPPSQRLTT
jgi:hypothetical protein